MMSDLYEWPDRPARFDMINHCIQKFGYKSYLEIGCANNQCFNAIQCDRKVGVDPVSGGTLRMKSDEYFQTHDERFDIVFVDGLHIYEQAYRDVHNALAALNSNGTIVMHDCIPVNEGMQRVPRIQTSWTGNVWKAAVRLRMRDDVDVAVALIDAGVGVVRPRINRTGPITPGRPVEDLTWEDFVKNHVKWLNAMSYDDVLKWL